METVSRYCTAESNLNDFQRDPRNLQRFAESEIAFALTHALTQLRLARGISLEDMAARVGRTPTYIARLEEGAYARCTVPALRTFARALGYDLDTNMSALFSEIPEALFAHDVGVEMVLDGILRAPSHEIAQPADAVPSAERLDELVQAYESNEVIGAVVSDAVKGGVVVDFGGIRGFVPASQLGGHAVENHADLVGQFLHFKVLDLDRERKSAVLSERESAPAT